MGLYAIGDLHLSLSTDKPMDVFGKEWKNHVEKIEKNWIRQIRQEDTVVITGDHSWGRNLNESRADLGFIASLPGRKILLRGNHDMFWDAKKTRLLNELYKGKLFSCRTTILPMRILQGMSMPLLGPRDIAMKERIPRNTFRKS